MKFKSLFVVWSVVVLSTLTFTQCITKSDKPLSQMIDTPITQDKVDQIVLCDSTELTVLYSKLFVSENILGHTRDSLDRTRDSLTILTDEYNKLRNENLVNKIKLERIREYNRIAGINNNLKYLRGWLNRVLND